MSSSTVEKLSDLFYEKETEYFGVPPFFLLDEIGLVILNEVSEMAERCPIALSERAEFLSQAQIEAVG